MSGGTNRQEHVLALGIVFKTYAMNAVIHDEYITRGKRVH